MMSTATAAALTTLLVIGSLALPTLQGDVPVAWAAAGAVVAAVLAASPWVAVATVGVLSGAAVVDGLTGALVGTGGWAVLILAPLLAAGAARVRVRAGTGSCDPMEALGAAVGAALLAAAGAGALGLAGGATSWALSVGLGVLVSAPVCARLFDILHRLDDRPAPDGVPAVPPATRPDSQPDPTSVDAAPPLPVPPPADRVLVVEDDPVNRRVAVELLKARGFTVEMAEDGQIGVERAAGDAIGFGVILMDLHMPQLDGISAIRRIRSLDDAGRAAARIVLLTADTTDDARSGALAAGADACLLKPFRADALVAAVTGQERGAQPAGVQPTLAPDHDLDLALLQGRLEAVGGASLERILGLFRSAVPRHVERLHAAVRAGDGDAMVAEAHALKGASAVVGAGRLADLAVQLEDRARLGDLAGAARILIRLEAVAASTQQAADAFARARLGSPAGSD